MTVVVPSIDNIKASDGLNETVRAIVTDARAISSSIIKVNSIVGFNDLIIGTTGALDANDELTIRPQVFFGHLSGADINIDSYAPGYTDQGNEVGDIVIIKPTTAWADEVAAVLGVSHNDNGTLKDNIVDTPQLATGAVTADEIEALAVIASKIDFSTIVPAADANGWSKQGYNGTKFKYTKTITGSTGSIPASGGTPITLLDSSSLPVGVANLTGATVKMTASADDSTGAAPWLMFSFGYTTTNLRAFVRNGYGGSALTANYTITIEVIA